MKSLLFALVSSAVAVVVKSSVKAVVGHDVGTRHISSALRVNAPAIREALDLDEHAPLELLRFSYPESERDQLWFKVEGLNLLDLELYYVNAVVKINFAGGRYNKLDEVFDIVRTSIREDKFINEELYGREWEEYTQDLRVKGRWGRAEGGGEVEKVKTIVMDNEKELLEALGLLESAPLEIVAYSPHEWSDDTLYVKMVGLDLVDLERYWVSCVAVFDYDGKLEKVFDVFSSSIRDGRKSNDETYGREKWIELASSM